MGQKQHKGLSRPSPWTLEEEEMRQAGWQGGPEVPQQAGQDPKPGQKVPHASTVVRSVWDPLREKPDETVDETILEELPQPDGQDPGSGAEEPPPAPRLLLCVCVGFALGFAAGWFWDGNQVFCWIVGIAAGLVAGSFWEFFEAKRGRKKQ